MSRKAIGHGPLKPCCLPRESVKNTPSSHSRSGSNCGRLASASTSPMSTSPSTSSKIWRFSAVHSNDHSSAAFQCRLRLFPAFSFGCLEVFECSRLVLDEVENLDGIVQKFERFGFGELFRFAVLGQSFPT